MNVITSSEDNKKCYPCCWTLLLPMIPAAQPQRPLSNRIDAEQRFVSGRPPGQPLLNSFRTSLQSNPSGNGPRMFGISTSDPISRRWKLLPQFLIEATDIFFARWSRFESQDDVSSSARLELPLEVLKPSSDGRLRH